MLALQVAEMTAKEALEQSQAADESSRPCFVDCRTEPERAVSMLPGALSVHEFEANMMRDGAAWLGGRPVVPYCTIGYRSAQYTQELQARHPEVAVSNMAGSILMWTHEGGTLEASPTAEQSLPEGTGRASQQQEVRRIHVYGGAWDLAPLAYEARRFDG